MATGQIAASVAAALPCAARTGARGPGWRLDAPGLRNAAWALGHRWLDGAWRPAEPVPHRVALGVIARGGDRALVPPLARHGFAAVVVALDGTQAEAEALQRALPDARIERRPLAGDFAAQRNRVQRIAGEACGGPCWVLQLDTDEQPTPALLASLGWLCEAADRDGLRSLGLPRINLVDGVRSALYPDIQYRLNRGDVLFEGAVHERPAVPFAQSSLALCGAIEHRLCSRRVRERSRIYEAMRAGAGRAEDEAALLRRFDPHWMA